MHDLRKQVLLESGKTVSRKARSKTTTPPLSRGNSAAASPAGSRVASRAGSEDEGEFSDDTEWSTNSLDASLELDPDEVDNAAWVADLEDRVEGIIDRKRSSTEGREQRIGGLITVLSRHVAQRELKPKLCELIPALLKSVKGGQSEAEVCFALKALALILVTDPSEDLYDELQRPFKSIINDTEGSAAKIAALHALSIATFYGGATLDETQEVMEYFLDIASSDGAMIGEEDNAHVVVACLQEWGFLATQLDDLEDVTENAMDTFVDQLESNDVGVQVASGDNIALLYEASAGDADSDDGEAENGDSESKSKSRYTVYRQHHQLQKTLEGLVRSTSKRISKQDRKHMRVEFRDVLSTIEVPTRGPRYSTALDPETGREYGSRMKVAIHGLREQRKGASRSRFMLIDKWWQLHRLNGLKRLLQGGFLVHYEFNQTVYDSLPDTVEDDDDDDY